MKGNSGGSALKNGESRWPSKWCTPSTGLPKDAASAPALPVAVVAQPVATEAPAPAMSGGEQRKLDAQRRQNMATQTRPLKKELDQNEQRMAVVEKEKADLEALLATPISPAEIADAGRRLKALTDEVAGLEERWLELTAQLESMA